MSSVEIVAVSWWAAGRVARKWEKGGEINNPSGGDRISSPHKFTENELMMELGEKWDRGADLRAGSHPRKTSRRPPACPPRPFGRLPDGGRRVLSQDGAPASAAGRGGGRGEEVK